MPSVSYPNVPPVHADAVEHRRQIATRLNQVLLGRLNNTGTVTLGTSVASTDVADRKVSANSVILLTPSTANAATEAGSGNMYVSAVTAEQFTITHTNSATTARTFSYAVLG